MQKQKLLSLLEERRLEYEIIKHDKPLKTAQEGAEIFGIEIGQTAPTLILKTDRDFYSLILSGNYGRVDVNILKELLNVQQAKLAKPDEVEELTGSRIGSVSLINPGIPTLLDRELYRFPHIYGGTGEPNTTLKIQPSAVELLNNVVGYIR